MRRTLFRMRLPLVLFIMIILVLYGASAAMLYTVFSAHVKGDYFKLETNYLELDFPRNWVATTWQETNSNGSRYGITFFYVSPPYINQRALISILDDNLSETFMRRYNLTDATSIIKFGINETYNSVSLTNDKVTLHFIDNGTLNVSGRNFQFITVTMQNGFIDASGTSYNATWTFMAYVDRRVYQVIFFDVEPQYAEVHENVLRILNSTKIKFHEENIRKCAQC